MRESALARDLGVLRRYFWLPVVTLGIAVSAAVSIGILQSGSGEARFRENVIIDALPPLFGPAVLPSPFDYARLATSDGVLQGVSQRSNIPVEQLRGRLTAEARFNRPEVDFKVTGGGSLPLARSWQAAFGDAAASQTPAIELLLVQPYARQLDESRGLLEQRAAAAAADPNNAVLKQELTAAQENFETASKLSQSYAVIAKTMKANALAVVVPYERGGGISSTAGRLAAAVAIGLLAGVFGVLVLDFAMRRRLPDDESEPLDARPTLRQRNRHLS